MSAPQFRWVASAPLQLTQLLSGHGLADALEQGRVFVDGQRASGPREVAGGGVVEVFPLRPQASIELLREVEQVVAVYKPAPLVTEPDKSGADCVLSQLALRLGVATSELFAISRLDVGVSGVLLVAVTAEARQRLLAERAAGTLTRRYVALAAGVPEPAEGEWNEALGPGGAGKRALARSGQGGQSARTRYRVVGTARSVVPAGPATSLLALSPVTGRTHQLRVHASAHGAPLLGDRKYAGPVRMTAADGAVRALTQVLLHAAWVEWGPAGRRQRVVSKPVGALSETWLALGGEASALELALD